MSLIVLFIHIDNTVMHHLAVESFLWGDEILFAYGDVTV